MQEFVRRYSTAVVVVILLVSASGLFLLARQGMVTHAEFNREVRDSLERQRSLAMIYGFVSSAESGQRGYLLTGNPGYLQPYMTAKAEVWGLVEHLNGLYRDVPGDPSTRLRTLQLDLVDKLGEMESTLVLYDGGNPAAAIATVQQGVGRARMARIGDTIFAMKEEERQFLQELSARWLRERDEALRLNLVAFGVNVTLILLAGYLIQLEKRVRARYAADLEASVEQRTRELSQLSSHLQSSIEHDRRELARELHDELGGLLVAVKMDLAQLRRRAGDLSSEATAAIFKRMESAIDEGVALKRRVIEELRPSLLDNVGVAEALRWQFDESCRRAGLQCMESVVSDLQFTDRAGIHVFRIGQEAMTNVVRHAQASEVSLTLELDGDEVVLRVADNGRGLAPHHLAQNASHGLSGIRHRVRELGGVLWLGPGPRGGTVVEVRLPATTVLRGYRGTAEAAQGTA